jgi:hypothetical protein
MKLFELKHIKLENFTPFEKLKPNIAMILFLKYLRFTNMDTQGSISACPIYSAQNSFILSFDRVFLCKEKPNSIRIKEGKRVRIFTFHKKPESHMFKSDF